MNKAREMVAVMLLMAFGLVSVSFGVDLLGEEEHFEKLKAEVEEYGGEECKWSEDGKIISGDLCQYKKILMFFDEIRAREVKSCGKWAKTCFAIDKFDIAVKEVKEKPLFKNDIKISNYRWNNSNWWESVFDEWDKTKRQLRMDGARRGYWKKLAE